MTLNTSFMPVPNTLADALMRSRLSGGQWRVFMWTLRNTRGWNRDSTAFTWYRVAKEIGMNRSSTLRAARVLIEASLLSVKNGHLSIETDPARWSKAVHTGTGATTPHNWCSAAPVCRRAIDMSNGVKKKERNTTKKERESAYNRAGAARPIPGKYARVSES
jgi:phage replication O-like protein O